MVPQMWSKEFCPMLLILEMLVLQCYFSVLFLYGNVESLLWFSAVTFLLVGFSWGVLLSGVEAEPAEPLRRWSQQPSLVGQQLHSRRWTGGYWLLRNFRQGITLIQSLYGRECLFGRCSFILRAGDDSEEDYDDVKIHFFMLIAVNKN